MSTTSSIEDTIVAISTPVGQGSIGIVRLSGPEALSIADSIFVSKNKKKPSTFKSFTVHYGWIVRDKKYSLQTQGSHQPDDIVDEVLLTIMRAPHTYTKQDIVEISCHGGIVPLRAILTLAVTLGARLAEPGEFTKRAFLNGRIDLPQAEAVLDIIQAKTEAFLKVSTNQLKGELSRELEDIREALMGVYTEIEAVVNFPEEDLNAQSRENLSKGVKVSRERVGKLLETSEHGRILKEGIKIVICGKSNVGKSSLLNVLLRQPRAIVSDIAGTTRDTIEELAHIQGIPFQLIDTAGIIKPRDFIEEEAVKRSHMHIQSADLILFVFDASEHLSQEDRDLMATLKGKNIVIVFNKCDLSQKIEKAEVQKEFHKRKAITISALKKIDIKKLEEIIIENIWHSHTVDTQGLFICNVRHVQALRTCHEALEETQGSLTKNYSLEFVSEGIKRAIISLDVITGRNIDKDLLENIFSQFCIGK